MTDKADGRLARAGAEYDRDPEQIEFPGPADRRRPAPVALAEQLLASVDEAPDDAPPEMRALAREARTVLRTVTDVLAAPTGELAAAPTIQAA